MIWKLIILKLLDNFFNQISFQISSPLSKIIMIWVNDKWQEFSDARGNDLRLFPLIASHQHNKQQRH